jgi:serine/threonine protein kinase
VDYWSFGALLYEMISGAPPFYSKDRDKMFSDIISRPIEMRPFFSDDAKSLLKSLLTQNPSSRLRDAGRVKAHPFFSTMDWEALAAREIKPPFQPNVRKESDTRNFDKQFTEEPAVDS